MRLRLRDKRLEVLARAAGWSAANLAARLRIDLRTLQTLMPDRDYVPGGGLEVVCSLFGLSEDEYCHFSPLVPDAKAPRRTFVRSRAEGLACARAAIAKREQHRNATQCIAEHVADNLEDGITRCDLQKRLLATVSKALRRARIPGRHARRCRRHFRYVGDMLSLTGLDRLVRNLKSVRFFKSVDALNSCLSQQSLDVDWDNPSLGAWFSLLRSLYLTSCDEPAPVGCKLAERAIYAHEIVHALDQDPQNVSDRISDTTAWCFAWATEIDCDDAPLAKYAQKSTYEGFAEFGALALTNPVFARRAFPMCWAVWRQRHLDADLADAVAPADRPTVAAKQPLSTSDAIPAVAATAAEGATAAA
jgi:hypothetical protein